MLNEALDEEIRTGAEKDGSLRMQSLLGPTKVGGLRKEMRTKSKRSDKKTFTVLQR